jgi:hypothetical protein
VKSPLEKTIMDNIQLKLGARPDVRLWRNNVGAYKDERGHLVRYGRPGSADLTGLVLPDGVRLEVEVKRPGGKLSEDQQKFAAMTMRFGGIYILATSVEQAEVSLNQALAERAAARAGGTS